MKLFKKIILPIAYNCIIVLILLEVFLQIYNPFPFRIRGDEIVLPANQKYIFTNSDGKIRGVDSVIVHTKNSYGFRGKEIEHNLHDTMSIIVIGGSTTECFYVSDGKTGPDLLLKLLSDDFDNVFLNNAGLDGHSTFGHIILLRDYIVKLKPRIAIFLVGINDVGRQDLNRYDLRILKSKKGILKSLELPYTIYNISRVINARNRVLQHNDLNIRNYNYYDVPLNLQQMEFKKHFSALISYKSRLNEIVSICRDYSIIPIFISQPAIYGTYNDVDPITKINLGKIKIGKTINGEKSNGYLQWQILTKYNEITQKVAVDNGIIFINLAKKMPKRTDLFYDSIHFTNLGCEVVAEIIYPQIKNVLTDIKNDIE